MLVSAKNNFNITNYQKRYGQDPNIVFLTGGTGCRHLAMEICNYIHSKYIIGVADSGRSTRQLRLLFDMLAIGDLRSRLIDLADTKSPGYKETTKLLKHRLSGEENEFDLERELNNIIRGEHFLVESMLEPKAEPADDYARIILPALREFQRQRAIHEHQSNKKPFDLRNASIGNLFLTGAYFTYAKDIHAPIFLYSKLADVRGDVIPATIENIHLAAEMANGDTLIGQHKITKSEKGPVKRLWYLDRENEAGNIVYPVIDPKAERAIANASLIVFSMGSFYTSILSTLCIKGMAEAIRKSSAPKIFISNSVQDAETLGMSAGSMAQEIIKVLRENDNGKYDDTNYLNYVIANDDKNSSEPLRVIAARDGLTKAIDLLKYDLTDGKYYNPKKLIPIIFSVIK